MAEAPWLTILGLGEDGPAGLTDASRAALDAAEVVMGPARHLALLPGLAAERVEWPVPFADGVPVLLGYRGRRVVMLASGDPFWFGAGTVVTRELAAGEWVALPGASCFSLAASRLGWGLEGVTCLGLHAAPLSRLRSMLAPGARAVVTLRDGAAVAELAGYLESEGFGASALTVMEALGGPRERVRRVVAGGYALEDVQHPVVVAVELAGDGAVMGAASGRADQWFANDGQITKRPVRALALSALAPKPSELLWDIGAGSGSIGIEWLLSHPSLRAIGFEGHPDRAARARENALRLGVDRLVIVEGRAPDVLLGQPLPDAVFIGGGLSQVLLDQLYALLKPGTRLVAHAVTLESEAMLAMAHAAKGGNLLRVELAEAQPLGARRGWKSAYPIVQWSVTL
ncbi:precorrin-6y C5,15-methyltransferase (decarboxylating) subunit CbiE [Cereibacter sphaeroides]|nr:precorrin-6y C5,15-methyltransferase (decarboxylating) subunit CbiE [Cereibacter sphaeroides]